ncbi:hypothetical protein FEM33_07640 [Dyadobacter flavalbus]|uniref:DUF6985 domain-containing protein n=1 Tax=Dyadobacter flavalbus TaxID=2579942 RepID=A0A5M8QVW8_9BACT|nr:hypothetical protein [Dyadobacter flavalbus]KAA6440455.1 hypothetical protein FEM33_07640 [Dyadobacter flavalbus]
MTIESGVIGKLKQHRSFSDWWESKFVEIPLFGNQELIVYFIHFNPENDKSFIPEADEALRNFLKLDSKDRNDISELVYKNCIDYFEITGFDLEVVEMFKQIKNPETWHLHNIRLGKLLHLKDVNGVWDFVKPKEIYVKRRQYNEKDIYVVITCQCDWEDEHGLQLVYRQGKKLTRVSADDDDLTDADAYNIPDNEDEMLSKF